MELFALLRFRDSWATQMIVKGFEIAFDGRMMDVEKIWLVLARWYFAAEDRGVNEEGSGQGNFY